MGNVTAVGGTGAMPTAAPSGDAADARRRRPSGPLVGRFPWLVPLPRACPPRARGRHLVPSPARADVTNDKRRGRGRGRGRGRRRGRGVADRRRGARASRGEALGFLPGAPRASHGRVFVAVDARTGERAGQVRERSHNHLATFT
ncbi:hypothetical protein Anae109_1515 [Anaeromyxobacter sp. Fw109-5]|nr:hypothetical protein Anae109_1515 [Anaeromyxobacter sp. Fw109-5]